MFCFVFLAFENIFEMKRITYRKYIENGPKRGGPAVWDPVCKLMVPCSSCGGYHVGGGGGDFHGLHCTHTLTLFGC